MPLKDSPICVVVIKRVRYLPQTVLYKMLSFCVTQQFNQSKKTKVQNKQTIRFKKGITAGTCRFNYQAILSYANYQEQLTLIQVAPMIIYFIITIEVLCLIFLKHQLKWYHHYQYPL